MDKVVNIVEAVDKINAALGKLSFIGDAIMDGESALSAESRGGLSRIISEIHQDLEKATDQLFAVAKQAGSVGANVA